MKAQRRRPAPPSVTYQIAFDCCAVEAARADGAVGVLPSSRFYLRAIAARLPATVALCRPEMRPPGYAGPEVDDSQLGFREAGSGPAVATIVWVEPDAAGLATAEGILRQHFGSGGRVVALASNRLRSVLPEWQGRDGRPAVQPLGARAAAQILRRCGGRVVRGSGVQGMASLCYGALARPALMLGRPDLADRLNAAARGRLLTARFAAAGVLTLLVTEG